MVMSGVSKWLTGGLKICQPARSCIKDAGITIRHSQGYIVSILQDPEMGLRELSWCVQGQKKQVDPITNILFCHRKIC